MPDIHHNIFPGFAGPYTKAALVTPDDQAELSPFALALWIGGAGSLTVLLRNDTVPVTIPNVAASIDLPLRLYVRKVLATRTTATGIIALSA